MSDIITVYVSTLLSVTVQPAVCDPSQCMFTTTESVTVKGRAMATKAKVLVDKMHFDPDYMFNAGPEATRSYAACFDLICEEDLIKNPSLCGDIEVIILGFDHISASHFPKYTGLKMVCQPSAGLDNISLPVYPQLKKMGVRLVHTPQAVAIATSDMAMSLLLSSARQVTASK